MLTATPPHLRQSPDPGFDRDCRAPLRAAMVRDGIGMMTSSEPAIFVPDVAGDRSADRVAPERDQVVIS